MEKQFSEAGIVLKTTALGESDLIVTILTRKLGKISAVVRSARSSKKRFLGGVEIFDSGLFELQIPKGKSQLYSTINISSRKSFSGLRENLDKLSLASYALEVAVHFCPEEDALCGELFKPLYICLRELEKADDKTLRRCILVLYLLIVLQVSGHDAMEANLAASDAVKIWWAEMLARQVVIVPGEEGAVAEGAKALNHFVEEIVGRKLNSGCG